ncbi:hypothetical protein [Streptomyces sp. NPDC046988]|uniref:hypothetical protein n=1 Tax=Streptomyces sp. NPDC046988 TaxID=3154922 RepID=UPI0033DC466B
MPAAPKPTASVTRERWFQPLKSGFRWEQEGLDHLRALMPRTEPFRACATFIVLGRVAPFGIGAVIGGGADATLAVRAGRPAFRVVERLTSDERR